MNLKRLAIGTLTALFVILIASVAMLLLSSPEEVWSGTEPSSSFEAMSFRSVGGQGYALFSHQGEGEATLLSLRGKPSKKVFIYNDPQAVAADRIGELEAQLKALEPYGYEITVTESSAMGEGVYVVPTGAMPVFILAKLKNNYSAGAVLYMGQKDLILSNGIKMMGWYEDLEQSQRSSLMVYDTALEDYLEGKEGYLIQDILHEVWHLNSTSTISFSGQGVSSLTVPMGQSGHLRLIHTAGDSMGAEDSGLLSGSGALLMPEPASIYPWQRSDLQFSLGKTNGTASMAIEHNGVMVLDEELSRVTDENVFLKRLRFEEPGDYLISVGDNSGILASGILHVSELSIRFIEQTGITYTFYAESDGEPLKNAEVMASLSGSSNKKRFYISEGYLRVPANTEPGKSVFEFELYEGVIPVTVESRSANPLDFYLRWGIPAALIVAVVYFGARLSRRPVYTLRFGESGNNIRQEVQLSVGEVKDLIAKTREDLRLGSMPITPQEYTVSLRRHITNGADVTEGNVEDIFKRLVSKGMLASHREFYQFPDEGDVRKSALRRLIKERLIENGVMYKEGPESFTTKDFEIGFFGTRFKKKGIVIFDDEGEMRRTLASLSEAERVELRLRQANDLLVLMPVDRLSDVL